MNLDVNNRYYDRELSWLSFNRLVLEQIKDKNLPLFERIKFLAIYSSNLDEFYRVRVAYYRSIHDLPDDNIADLEFSPEEILENIKKEVSIQHQDYENEYYNCILPELDNIGIVFFNNQTLGKEHKEFIEDYFFKQVLPEIQPVLLSSTGAVMSFLKDNEIYLAIKMWRKNRPGNKKPNYAAIQVPSHTLGRFVTLPKYEDKFFIIFLEDIIRQHLHTIFPGYKIESSFSIKLSRNADLLIDDEFSGDLLTKLKKSLQQRKTGFPARFMYDKKMPPDIIEVLKLAFNITAGDFVPVGRYLGLSDFFTFTNPLAPKYELEPLKQLRHPLFDKFDSIFDAVENNDILLHFPYHTYDYVLRFFSEAAIDPDVEEIKTTQYRVATNSAIVNALITAARNGKDVTVFVEVKARFDEEININFADKMKNAGINVIAGIPGLKVHAKAAIVTRKCSKEKNTKKTYAFVSTGNFNEKTAKHYSDQGFFTSNIQIINDLKKLFLYLEVPLDKYKFNNILVPRFNMIKEFKKMTEREIQHAKQGKKAYIIMKMNGLGEKEMIDILYDAGEKNVKIDLIIRGICRLRPGLSYSENIKVTRIVDRFLEHSRIYAFYNEGNWDVFISSSDLMERNIRRRIETTIPIYNKKLKKEIIDILKIQLKDNTKAKYLDGNINNIDKKKPATGAYYRSQIDTYLYLEKKSLMGG
jgi:polyphosphate kinase